MWSPAKGWRPVVVRKKTQVFPSMTRRCCLLPFLRKKLKRASVFFLFVFLLGRTSAASVAPLTESFPPWGTSCAEVLYRRAPVFAVGKNSVSLLFEKPVYALLTEEVVGGVSASVLYFFLDDRLIEYTVSFRNGEDTEKMYRCLREELLRTCQEYDGGYFSGLKDVFINREHTTLYLLVAGRNLFLFALDAAAYAACRSMETLP